MRFLVDFNVGRAVANYLRQAGYDVTSVGDVDPRMSDADILLWAVREQRIVLTMDTDFGELVYHSGHAHASDLPGHFCVFHAGRLRIRP